MAGIERIRIVAERVKREWEMGNEVAVVTAYWYAGQTDLTRERVRVLRAALADR